jgi:UDP-N-acetylglucosamine 2-epimerase
LAVTVISIVGARPEFVKCAPVSRRLRRFATEILVHTGQHYDQNMSEVFFGELDIPEPDYNLGVGSGSQGFQTGEMIKGIEKVLMEHPADWVLVYGGTNSTLAGALAAAKLHVPVAHVEAGLRSFNRHMPEEVNWVVTDHLASLLFCPTPTAVNNLAREGITAGVHLTGDVMYEALLYNLQTAQKRSQVLQRLGLRSQDYMLATVHRAENTDAEPRLRAIFRAFSEIAAAGVTVVFPAHPRTRARLASLGLTTDPSRDHKPQDPLHTASAGPRRRHPGLLVIDPVSYLDMIVLEKHAKVVLTDSGGVQKEARWLEVPCLTLRQETEWVETVRDG